MNVKKIKVCHIITSLGYGGAERVIFDLVRFGDKEKFDFYVLTVVGGGDYQRKLKLAGAQVTVNQKLTKLGLGVFLKLYFQLKKIQPDIVHSHLWAGDTWGRLAAKMAGVPVIISTAHNIDLDEGFFKKKIKKFLARYTDRVIAVSDAVKKYSIEKEKIPAEKLQVIYNGVEVGRFFVAEPKILSGPEVKIAIIGRLAKQKGHEVLLEALGKMRNRNFVVKVVGVGELEKKLRAICVKLKIKNRVEFVGVHDDIAGYLRTVDIVIQPSLWEGLGLVLIEAGLAGRAIVASRVGGIPEVVIDKKTGLLVEPNDPEKLAEALDWLIDHPDQARQFGMAAQKHAQKFDMRKMVKEYEDLYWEF